MRAAPPRGVFSASMSRLTRNPIMKSRIAILPLVALLTLSCGQCLTFKTSPISFHYDTRVR